MKQERPLIVGKIVHYYREPGSQPCAAIVVSIENSFKVNLTIFNKSGGTDFKFNVPRLGSNDIEGKKVNWGWDSYLAWHLVMDIRRNRGLSSVSYRQYRRHVEVRHARRNRRWKDSTRR